MNHSTLSVLGFCMVTSLAFGSSQDNLATLERDWARAMVHRDKAALEAIMAPDFTYIDESGHLMTRKQFVAAFVSGDLRFDSAKVAGLKPRVYGDAAVVTGVFHAKGHAGKADISGSYPFTDTFARQNGRWVAVAAHTSRLAK